MSTILGFNISHVHLMAGGFILLFSLLLLGLIYLMVIASRLKDLEGALQSGQKTLLKEVGLNSPTRAAIAAVMATDKNRRLSMEQFQAEISALTEQWDEIESLANQAHNRLADLVDESEKSARH
ncbi:hypothetical protein JCM17846_25500 [Iodidimonas nitroreducens]|uniref:Uncharacterized protein n=1 Tax=Iodidimonas nitroreducens TaxID=1236968 RepID=A0A5A7N9T6_9PROT|nr:hypothetical protein [Iodidimonas nitroreducens]GAK32259.1 hypothetical protein AQ1_00123 [alpha proteobacterium Q-1]GER04868.1 hypothetical protein JCM17846_25500 [Iodidimonas nitroreducens]